MEIELIIACAVFLGLCFAGYMALLEEKQKCKHKWEETNRLTGYNMLGSLATRVDLRCIKCGEVQSRTL